MERVVAVETALEAWINAHPEAYVTYNNEDTPLEFIYASIGVPTPAVPAPTDPLVMELLRRRADAHGISISILPALPPHVRLTPEWHIMINPHPS